MLGWIIRNRDTCIDIVAGRHKVNSYGETSNMTTSNMNTSDMTTSDMTTSDMTTSDMNNAAAGLRICKRP